MARLFGFVLVLTAWVGDGSFVHGAAPPYPQTQQAILAALRHGRVVSLGLGWSVHARALRGKVLLDATLRQVDSRGCEWCIILAREAQLLFDKGGKLSDVRTVDAPVNWADDSRAWFEDHYWRWDKQHGLTWLPIE